MRRPGIKADNELYQINLVKFIIGGGRYGLNILCLPDAHAVELVERQIACQKNKANIPEEDSQF